MGIYSVGIDFHQGKHRVRCLDEKAQPCDSFVFETTPEGLATFERRVFVDGASPIIIFEPAGIPWLTVAAYLKSLHPGCSLKKAKMQKVAALRKYLRGPYKSDRIDALTLAKMPFIDPEQLEDVYLPSSHIHVLQRLTRQRKRLMSEISGRKVRIEAIVDGYLPGMRRAFKAPWSLQFRAFLKTCLNPFNVVSEGEKSFVRVLTNEAPRARVELDRLHEVYVICQSAVTVYQACRSAGSLSESFFEDLQEELARELRLMEAEEAECEALEARISQIYHEVEPSDNLSSIPGVGEHTAPVFLAAIGDPERFRNQAAFANWTGAVPRSRQSADSEAKGLRMTKSGPSIVRMALFQSADIARRWDPQMAALYYRQMVYHGKNHKQAVGAVMTHLGARVLKTLSTGRPYQLRDAHGAAIDRERARELILSDYQVPELVRGERRRRNTKTKTGKPNRKLLVAPTVIVA